MRGLTVTSQGNISAPIPLDWQIAGIGDIDGDGKADIIWRNTTTGQVYAWLMNGLTVTSQGNISAPIPLDWQIDDGRASNVHAHAHSSSPSTPPPHGSECTVDG